MSLQQEIRDVLKAAAEPMKAGEIREAVGADDYTTEQVGAALYALADSGAVEKLGERGTYRYHLVPGWKPRGHSAGGAPAAQKPERKAAPKLARRASDHVEKPVTGKMSDLPAASSPDPGVELLPLSPSRPRIQDLPVATVTVPRRTLRTLLAGVLMFGGDLGPELRQAVRDATEAAA